MDMHNGLFKFEFWADGTSDYGDSCTLVSKNICFNIFSVAINSILLNLQVTKNMYEILDDFEFRQDN